MCMTCGCGEPHADHGDPNNITYEMLQKAAKAADITPKEAADNIQSTLSKV